VQVCASIRVAVSCSALQCLKRCYNVLSGTGAGTCFYSCHRELQYVAVCLAARAQMCACIRVAVSCNELKCGTACCSVLQSICWHGRKYVFLFVMQCVAASCSVFGGTGVGVCFYS